MKSTKIIQNLDKAILELLNGKALEIYRECLKSDLFCIAQEHANLVSKNRLNINDHGKIHMRKVTMYGIQIRQLLNKAKISLTGQNEDWCNYEDSISSIILSSFTHDFGMSIHRDRHEFFSILLANNEIEAILNKVYLNDLRKKYYLKSLIIESITGHMGNQKISSLEAGILLVADGCDLEYGRANSLKKDIFKGNLGDIHSYSASCIEKVEISEGRTKPILINVQMSESAGYFQIEEILMRKVLKSTIKDFVEIIALNNTNKSKKKYL